MARDSPNTSRPDATWRDARLQQKKLEGQTRETAMKWRRT
jgi:hypothetical protein